MESVNVTHSLREKGKIDGTQESGREKEKESGREKEKERRREGGMAWED